LPTSSREPALRVRGLGKRYRIGARRESYATLRDALANTLSAPFRRLRRSAERARATELWALRDLDLEVGTGEVVGIIGRNGAGKSTLLKVLSGITKPTAGRAEVWGRSASLLEVGTGFHPELTGRENIFLNGAILGMRRHEIARKFDEIVGFAEIARFLDTPVKRYSSGMYMRLAFSVAAHLEPDVLLVDEVLAVGDANFQRKSLGRMAEVGSQGRTVIFVSHNMPAVLRLCPRTVLLNEGRLLADGPTSAVVRSYLESGSGSSAVRVWDSLETAPGDDQVRLRAVRVRDDSGMVTETIDIRRQMSVEIEYWHLGSATVPSANLHFYNDDGVCLFVSSASSNPAWQGVAPKLGVCRSICRIPGNFLAEGRITVLAAVSSFNPTVIHALERDAVSFQIVDNSEGDGVRGEFVNEWPGVVRPMLEWTIEHRGDAADAPADASWAVTR
jgi:lipopolysaccharide transport system ATP-binding protein